MDSEIIVKGAVLAQKQSNFEGKISNSIQLMKRTARGAVELLNVKLPDGADPEKYKQGTAVELAVDVSTYEGNMYFKATRDVSVKTEGRGAAARETSTPAAKA